MSEFKKLKHANEKTIGGHPLKPIWKFYNRSKQLDSSGHYKAICKACEQLFSPRKPSLIEKNIINDSAYISEEVKETVIYIVESYKKTSRNSIYKLFKEDPKDPKQFYKYAINKFNSRFNKYEYDKYLLAYFLHPLYKASCERIWFICGWMTEKRRTNLLVENLESLVKIHSYYINNKESELNLYSKEHAKNLNLLEIIDLENNNFKDTDYNQITEDLNNNDELNTFIQDLEDKDDYDPSQIVQKHFDDIDEIYYY
ncbi:37076_t:CDS:2 [Gigaspora margarita]|uniref:37076_t:CDS:1 n=1 Tax=Gigaspora margarita TaxID=4874 RepID=A0ABN7VEL5_GIGMA|nr:37076_t:CDS:2 [Gigaspora margarita]